jgi:CRP-like cAMP-binding protein
MSKEQNSSGTAKGEGMAVKAVESVIAAHPFLRDLKPPYLRLLGDSAMRVRFEKDELIFREGDPANRFYLIEEGRVSLESHRRDEAPVAVQVIGPGEVLGWSWLFPPYYWQFDARALEPTTAIFFYGTRLREQCEQDHAFGYEMMKRMTQVVIHRLQATRKQLLSKRG